MSSIQPEKNQKRKRYSKRSWVWQFITENGNFAECNLCNEVMKYESSTSALIWHLEEKHKINSGGLCYNKKIKLALLSESDEDDENCNEINESSCSKKKITSLNNKLIDFIVANNLPVSLVKNVQFKSLMKEAVSSYTLPCRQTISNNLIPEKVK